MMGMRQVEVLQLQKDLKKIGTYDGITAIWAKHINQYTEPVTLINNTYTDKLVKAAMTNQQNIGWNNLLKGYLSTNWNEAQQAYLIEQKAGENPQWASKSINLLQSYTLKLWQYHNQYLHGIDIKENRKIRIEKTNKMIQSLYDNSDRIHIPLQDKTFDLPIQERLKSSLTAQIAWIDLANRRIRMHREEATKNTLDRWLVDKHTGTLASRERENEK